MSSSLSIYSKRLSIEEARAVYIGHAHRDFPSDELKPFSMIEKLCSNGCYECCGFYRKEDDGLCAYAFLMADADTNMLLLDYFAVCEELRGKGYGAAVLKILKQDYITRNGIIFEVEDDETADSEEEKINRKRRIAFYEKNGVMMTDEKSHAFGVDYKLMVMPLADKAAQERVGEKITSVYEKMLPQKIFLEMFRLR
ncbi:MAG: GNAT family N-acetyltransferase [Bacillus sp. (in: Bacteria)]|nr:GNAT family N-acetyltransferase [Bacillus sp. (in: firmicutes)]MCM1427086.1 GNAT family N-acetyltransferase [Eubacterium sp.]